MADSPKKRSPGRPRKYPKAVAEKHGGGAPQLRVRVEPDLFDWVAERGGSPWVRQVLATAREKGQLGAEDLAPLMEGDGS